MDARVGLPMRAATRAIDAVVTIASPPEVHSTTPAFLRLSVATDGGLEIVFWTPFSSGRRRSARARSGRLLTALDWLGGCRRFLLACGPFLRSSLSPQGIRTRLGLFRRGPRGFVGCGWGLRGCLSGLCLR